MNCGFRPRSAERGRRCWRTRGSLQMTSSAEKLLAEHDYSRPAWGHWRTVNERRAVDWRLCNWASVKELEKEHVNDTANPPDPWGSLGQEETLRFVPERQTGQLFCLPNTQSVPLRAAGAGRPLLHFVEFGYGMCIFCRPQDRWLTLRGQTFHEE